MWLHVHEGFVIAAVEVYWVVTSKKLNVMYSPYNTDMLHRFIITRTRKRTGSLVALASCQPCG